MKKTHQSDTTRRLLQGNVVSLCEPETLPLCLYEDGCLTHTKFDPKIKGH